VVKLADFGLAKLAGDPGRPGLTGSGMVFGTPHYMAPEQWHGSAGVDHRADIYSLGVVLYELLTGRLPVGTYAPASQQPGVPRGIDQVVQRSLQQEPERRYQSARDVQSDLEQQGRGLASEPVVATQSARRWLFASAAVLLVGGGALFVFWRWQLWLEAEHFLFVHESAQVEQVMSNVRATVERGDAWTAALPVAPVPPNGSMLPAPVRTALLATGGFAVVALVLSFAATARRRTHFASGSRGQFVLANLLLWSPVLVPAFAWLVVLGARYAQASNGLTTVPVLLTIFLVLFFAVRALWLAAGRRPAGEPLPSGTWSRVCMVVCVMLALGCVGTAIWYPRPSEPLPVVRTPIVASELIGDSRERLLARLGPPRSIVATPHSLLWSYRGIDGEERADALQVANGRVMAADASQVPLLPELTPAAAPYAGQSVDEVLQQLGPASSFTVGTQGMEMHLADGTTLLVGQGGVVVGVQR
jgi:hypothetical protein